jgi:hypothetical protein
MAEDSQLAALVPDVTWRTGLTARGAERIAKLLEAKRLDCRSLDRFSWGTEFTRLPPEQAERWFRLLINDPHAEAAFVLVDLMHAYYVRDKCAPPMPKELGKLALHHSSYFGEQSDLAIPQMTDLNWEQLADVFIRQHPEEMMSLSAKIIDHLEYCEANRISEVLAVLDEAVSKYPEAIWKLVATKLGSEDASFYSVGHWLEDYGILDRLPREEVLQWIHQDPKNRAPRIAQFLGQPLPVNSPESNLARELIMRYGEDPNVAGAIEANFMTGTWSGPEHTHYQAQRDQLVAILRTETDASVRRWLEDLIASLDTQIGAAKARDERDGVA